MSKVEEAQRVIDRAQVEFLAGSEDKEKLSAWFNACLNSATGPIAARYGHAATAGLLQMWVDTAREKAGKPRSMEN